MDDTKKPSFEEMQKQVIKDQYAETAKQAHLAQ